MKVRLLTPASWELDEAVAYYEQQLPGLGARFFRELSFALEMIKLLPEGWGKIGPNTSRWLNKHQSGCFCR